MRTARFPNGFSLVEVTLALGIMSFCLLALFGLLPVGLTSNQTSVEQTAAGSIATRIAADLRATPATSTTSGNLKFNMSGGDLQTLFFSEDGTATGAVGAAASTQSPVSRYRACVGITAGTGKKATMVRILITWPALADSSGAGLPKNFVGSFETVIALTRN